MTIRTVIVDDEPLARLRLRALLADADDIEIVAECADGVEASEVIEKTSPDILFLDIQMPERDGFDVLEPIGVGRVPVVIFVTAYDQFALRAFEAHALDYLLKPFDDVRFRAVLQRARDRIHQERAADLDRRLSALLQEARGDRRYLQRLVVPAGHRSIIIRTDRIDWIEADRNYIRLHVGGVAHLLRENLSHIEAALDPAKFCRIHRSTIVNVDRVHAVETLASGEYLLTLHDGTKLASGRNYRSNVFALIGKDR